MTRIDQPAQLATLIRSQIGAQWRARSKALPRTDAKAAAPSASAPHRSLQELVALRVRALAGDDPQRSRKAFRIFLESTLLQTFGRDHVNDPGFDQLVDKVLLQMTADVALDAALLKAGDQLLADNVAGEGAGHDAAP